MSFADRISRRSFLGLAAVLLPPSALAGFWGRREETADVIVVGAGGAGLAAALSAAEAGASVIVLEKQPAIGGNTLIASGLFNAADPERQTPQGIEDSADWHYEQTIKSGGGLSDPALVRRFADNALPTLHWLESNGIEFTRETYATWGAEWPRGHKPFLPRGTAYIRTLSQKLAEMGGRIETQTAATAILMENGRAAGIAAAVPGGERRYWARRGIVLAAGGYAANPERLRRWAPAYANYPTDNAPGSTGEVIEAAGQVGAKLVNLNCAQLVPGAPAGRNFQVRLDLDAGRSILIDGEGRRFADEVAARNVLSAAIREAAGGKTFVITDNAAVESYDLVSRKNIYRGLQTGDAFREETLSALAARIEVPAEALEKSVGDFNREVLAGSGKCAKTVCRPIEVPRFWASPVVLNIHSTMGGVAVTPDGAVLGGSGIPIPGLFAAGELVGNLHGANRIGGNGIAAAVTLGRIAGKSAAAER